MTHATHTLTPTTQATHTLTPTQTMKTLHTPKIPTEEKRTSSPHTP